MDMVVELEGLSKQGLVHVKDYFQSSGVKPGERVDRVLKLLGVYSRVRATRANETAILFAIGKQNGLRGRALSPLWERLTGTRMPVSALPVPPRGSKAAKKTK